MTSETPAAHLARIKVKFPTWEIWEGAQTGEYWAAPPLGFPGDSLISAASPEVLEIRIQDQIDEVKS